VITSLYVNIGQVRICGLLIRGNAAPGKLVFNTGAILGLKVGSVIIHGNLQSGINTGGLFVNSGAVEAAYRLGSVTVQGDVVGNAGTAALISGRGQMAPVGGVDSAIGSVHILGLATYCSILGGYVSFIATNPDAQIGSVRVDGDWTAGNIVAGVQAGDGIFGNPGDSSIAAPLQDTGIVARIGSIIIGGTVTGSAAPGDTFGFVAEQIGSVKVGTTKVALTAGARNDLAPVAVPSSTGDVNVLEVL
jgi:hypothetical protein